MPAKPIHRTPSAYSYQLLIKNILTTPLIYSPKQEIVYRDRLRYDYETFFNRVTRLAGMLQQQGVQPGDTVAIMDWDSHRYLECFFAVPMMGAVLHTINIRLSTEQLIYTINHAEDDVILVNAEFLRVARRGEGPVRNRQKDHSSHRRRRHAGNIAGHRGGIRSPAR